MGLTLYKRLLGEETISAAVPLFYDKVLADAALGKGMEDMDAPYRHITNLKKPTHGGGVFFIRHQPANRRIRS